MSRAECVISFSINDALSSIAQVVAEIEGLIGQSSPPVLHLDLRNCRYLGPDGAATLAAYCLEIRQAGGTLTIDWPAGPSRLLDFCAQSGLLGLIESGHVADAVPGSAAHPVMPVRVLKHASFQDADGVVQLICAHQAVSEDAEDSLRVCVNEVTQNIQDHADSRIGGVMIARYLRREVRVAIVDRGMGIHATLLRRYPDLKPHEALPRVVKGRYTSLSRPNNLGLGISNLVDVVRYQGGRIYLVSGATAVDCRHDRKPAFRELEVSFRGTGVFFQLPLRG